MKLKTREELPIQTKRYPLPIWLGPGDAECFAEFDIRAGGLANQPYMAAREQLQMKVRVAEMVNEPLKADPKAYVDADTKAARQIAKDRFGAMYDTCVISWNTNITDAETGKPIPTTREAFLELCAAENTQVAAMIRQLEADTWVTGAAVIKADQDAIKN